MPFCSVSNDNVKDIGRIVRSKIRKNPESLRNFKDFTQGIVQYLLGKNVPVEKAITLAKYIPESINGFLIDRANRDLLKNAGVSMDAIFRDEAIFDDYDKLASYVGLKAEPTQITIVNDEQLAAEFSLIQHMNNTHVKFDGKTRIINGKRYTTRATSIAKVGFENKQDPDVEDEDQSETPALKHGNTVDAIAKDIFTDVNPKYDTYKDLIEPEAFDSLVSKLKAAKLALQNQGMVFRTGVTLYNPALDISGEADIVAITAEAKAYIIDVKTARQRFNESYLKNDKLTYKSDKIHELTILSKWQQYGTQGYIYGKMLSDQIGIPVVNRTGIIGININYDANVPAYESKITKVVDIEMHNIPHADVRPEMKDKSVKEMHAEYEKLKDQELGAVNEVKERKPLTRRTQRKNLDRISRLGEIAATDAELKADVDWFVNNPVSKDTFLRLVDRIEAGVLGRWTLDAITIAKGAPQGTIQHEAWHRFSQVFLSENQRDKLYTAVKNDNIRFKTRDGRTITSKNASWLDIEEFLADEFAKYAKNKDTYAYPKPSETKSLVQKFFDHILQFLNRFFGINPRPLDLFQKLYTGKISDYVPSVNNASWNNLNSLVQNSKGDEIVSNERFPLYVRSVDYLIGKELRDAGKSFTAFRQSKRLQSQVINNVFATFEALYENPDLTDQQADEIFNIVQNQRDFVRSYLTATDYDTLKDFSVEEEVFSMTTEELASLEDIQDQYSDVEDIDDTEDLDSKPERFDRTGNEDSAFSIADDAIQDFFRTVPKIKSVNADGSFNYELNELGFPENHKYYDVFYKTKKILSGAMNMQDLKARMQDKINQGIFPELSIVSDFISKFMDVNDAEKNAMRRVQNVQFVQSFYHVMSMPEVANMQLTLNYLPLSKPAGYYKSFKPIMVSYRTASRSLALKIIKGWEKNFKDRRNKQLVTFRTWDSDKAKAVNVPLFLTEDGKILLNPFVDYGKVYPSTTDGVRDFWNVMGVTINPKAFKDRRSVDELILAKNTLATNIAMYRDSIIDSFMDDAKFYLAGTGAKVSTIDDILQALDPIAADTFAKDYYIGNPVIDFNEKKIYSTQVQKGGRQVNVGQMSTPMRFIFEDMAAIEEKFGDRVSSGSFKIEDKTKYPYYIPNQLLITTESVNKINHISEFGNDIYLNNIDPMKNVWMKRSYFMKRMFDNNGNRIIGADKNPVRIMVEDIASVRVLTDKDGSVEVVEKSPRSLTKDEKFFMDVVTLSESGALEIPRAETSSTMFSIRLSDYGKGRNTPISLRESLSGIPESFHAIVKDYFMAEIEKRQWWMKNDPDVKGANKIALSKQFNVFEGILPESLKDKITKNLDKTPEEIFAMNGLEAEFRAAITDYFNNQADELLPKLNDPKKGLSKDQQAMLVNVLKSPGLKMNAVARFFTMNQFVLAQEFYNIYFGDLYFYKNAFKRGKYVTNTGNSFYIDDIRNEKLNSIQNSTLHSIYSGTKPGGKDFRKINTAIMDDVEMKSSYVHENDDQNLILQGILKNRIDSGALVPDSPEYKKFVAETKVGLKKYDSINIADGQGIIGMDFYRNFSIMVNIWDEKKEKEYERQKAIYRNHFNLYYTVDAKGNRIAMEGEELRKAKEDDLRLRQHEPFAYFNPYKISYTGPQAKAGPTRPVFDKFSLRPVIPEAAIGKRDEALMNRMIEQDIDYVKFKSGSKVYQDSTFDWYKKVSDGVYDLNDFTAEEIAPNQLQAAFLKHQLSTEGFKEENILGSQFRKIVFGVKYSPLVRANEDLRTHFDNLEKSFKGVVDDMIAVEQASLFSLLGVTESKGTYRVTDMKRFLKLLQTESIKRGVAINNIDYVQYDEATKSAKYPIDYAFNRQQIQDLLSGLIDERLRRLKVNGTPLIQVSSAGTENRVKGQRVNFTNPTRAQIEQYGTNGLHYYHVIYDSNGKPVRTSTMGVKVSLQKEFRHLLDLEAPASLGVSDEVEKFGDEVIAIGQYAYDNPPRTAGKIMEEGMTEEEGLKRLNQALKDPEWKAKHMKKLILIGYRIPTQSTSFIDHMEIIEFLPSSTGAIIIGPPELIIKSGSDFDIDKMNVIRPVIRNGGDLVELPDETLEEIEKGINDSVYTEKDLKTLKKQYKDTLAGIGMDIDEWQAVQKKVRLTILDLAMKSGAPDGLLDEIIKRLKAVAPSILPNMSDDYYYSIPDEEAYPDEEEVQNVKFDLERATADFQRIDQEIERLKAEAKDINKNKGRIEGGDMKWFNKKRNYKNAKNNELIDILAKTLSHPYYYELLVTPSTASMFEGFTNDLIASQSNMTDAQFRQEMAETDKKLFDKSLTPQQASTYTATSESFDNLLSKRKDLGGYAIQRTFADIFNFINFSISKSYTTEVSSGRYETKTIHIPLVAPEDRSKIVQNGRILMHGDSVNGIPISKSFDELISLTVDLAGSPAYPHLGINNYNKKHVQYLLHQKTDPKAVIWFLNQPILKELFRTYEEKRRKVQGYTLKHAIVELSLKLKILENPNLYETGNKKKYEVQEMRKIAAKLDDVSGDVLQPAARVPNSKKANQYLSRPYWDLHGENITETDYFSVESMDAAIRSGQQDTPLQKKVLAYFASITEEADELMRLEFAENVDTTKYATLTSLIRNENNRTKVHNSDLFDQSQIIKLEKQSMIAPFDYTQKAKSILKALFPKLYTDKTIPIFSKLVTDVFGAKNTQIERISKIVENDFIEFIYKNYGKYQGQNLSDHFVQKLMNLDATQDHEYLTYTLNAIKAQYPELLDVPFVSALYEDVYFPPDEKIEDSYKGWDNVEIHNAFFLRNPDNPTFEKNVFTNNWRNLINFDPQRLGLKEQYSEDDIKKISEFFNELVYFSLYQSGLTNTSNGFSDLIPYEYWATFVQQAFDEYEKEKANIKDLETYILREFEYRFRQMNPKINWRTRDRVLDSIDQETGRNDTEEIQFYKNYYRGKDYRVTNDDLRIARTLYLTPQEELEDANKKIKGPEKQADMATFVPGRYVEFKGVKHVLIKEVIPGTWQMYNPLKKGPSAKVTARKSALNSLTEAGSLVSYGQKNYLVTSDKRIIDLDKSDVVILPSTDKNRINILKLAEQNRPPEPPQGSVGPDGQPKVDPC